MRPPRPIRDASYAGAELGHGAGYRYPHDARAAAVDQQYLPDELGGPPPLRATGTSEPHGASSTISAGCRAEGGGSDDSRAEG